MSEDQEFLRELQKEVLDELQFLLEACEESYLKIENPDLRVEELAKIFRLAHSIKGAGAAVGFTDLAAFAHVVEDCLAILREQPALIDTTTISVLLKSGDAIKNRIADLRLETPPPWDIETLKAEVKAHTVLLSERKNSAVAAVPLAPPLDPESFPPVPADETPQTRSESFTVKVDSGRIDTMLNIVGELVVIKSQIVNETYKLAGNARLNSVVSLLDKTIRDLQDRTLSMRLTSVKSLFLKAQRVARDLSVRLKKPIEFVMVGEETELDRNMVEQLSDPVVHLIRNSLDHGIESADVRKEKGKPEKGIITLSAQPAGGRVIIKISDDGGGIRRDKVLKKAREVGLVASGTNTDAWSRTQVYDLLFEPGFSTAEKVTDISGRGVGMNVVKENLESLKGRIEVESTEGQGALFKLSVPLTASITDGMLVSVNQQIYILPISGIRELIDLKETSIVKVASGESLLNLRGKFLPLVKLSDRLRSAYHFSTETPRPATQKEMLVVFEYEKGIVALEVDAVLGQTQVVMKPLGRGIRESEGIAGAAILGDGKVALLLDVDTMVPAAA